MQEHSGVEEIQFNGIWILVRVMSGNNENKNLVAQKGGLGEILIAMENHGYFYYFTFLNLISYLFSIVFSFLSFFLLLVFLFSFLLLFRGKFLSLLSYFTILFFFWSIYRGSEKVQKVGCLAIGIAARLSVHRLAIHHSRGISLLMYALRYHKLAPQVQIHAITAIYRMCFCPLVREDILSMPPFLTWARALSLSPSHTHTLSQSLTPHSRSRSRSHSPLSFILIIYLSSDRCCF